MLDNTNAETKKIEDKLVKIKENIVHSRKTLKWKLRATVGKRMAWRNTVEDQELTKTTL